jgi:M6 family metalloprotease-like protein
MAAVDGEHCVPSDAILLDESGWPGTTSLAFIRKGVPGGQHTVKAMWGVDGGQTGYMGDRNMTVLVFASDGPDMTGDFQALMPAIRSNPLLVLLWDPHRSSHPAPSVGAMSNLVHGSYPSVVDYFASLSGGRFTLANAGILGWYDAVMPADFYWAPNDPADADGDGFVSGHVRKWWEAISLADPVFNFASYDADGDGVLMPRELAIAIVIPQNGAFGTNRVPASREYPTWEPLVVDGVRIPVISEMYAGSPPNLGLFVHELCHLVLNLPDMYFGFFYPFAAGQYSIMDVTYIDSHLDPFAKMRLGWLQPTIVESNGAYSIAPCEAGGETYVLLDPKHGNSEYFLVENRQRSHSYDTQLSDSGLAVWHVIENPSVFGALSPPAGVSSTDWNAIPAGDWGRRAVRMIRPVYGPPFDNGRALWDGADPATGYDLVSDDPTPGHAQLRWADGSASGFAVRDISPAAGLMTVSFELPGTPTDAPEPPGLPSAFALDQNYPNPFNPSTTIRYRLPVASDVRLTVYDILGREVTRLLEGRQSAGSQSAVWDGSGSSSGLYFCRLDATGGDGVRFSAVVKMILMK